MTREAESVPPIDISKARVYIPIGLMIAALGASAGVGAALEKMPDVDDVETIASRASEAAVKAAISEDTPRRVGVQNQLDALMRSHAQLASSMAQLGTSVTRLEVYNEIQASSLVQPGTSSPKAVKMRRNLRAGRDPLEGIVPSE